MAPSFEWVVAGAGPAGIATVGLLLDAGVDGRQIAWIDPQFRVGDFGTAWRHVLSNTPVEAFMNFYRASLSFQFDSKRDPFIIERSSPGDRCPLMIAAEPLRWVTRGLMERVHATADQVVRLTQQDHGWRLTLGSGENLQARAMVLAFGAEPKRLSFCGLQDIPLAAALDPTLLPQHVQESDQVVLFGDAQSARSALQNLSKVKVKKIYHFYRSAESVERHMSFRTAPSAESMPLTPANLLATIPHCTKAIYASGFTRRNLQIDGLPEDFGYDKKTGIIAPGIFGAGIAFPEIRLHEMGRAEYHLTALQPFMRGLKTRLPLWLGVA